MDYLGIVKKAYEIVIKHKFLWIFGILAGGAGGSSSFNSNFSGSSSESLNQTFEKLNPGTMANFWAQWGGVILGIGVVIVILCLIIFILNIISQGALIASSAKLSQNEKADFKIGLGIGWHNFWRVLGVLVVFSLMILGSLVVLVVPVLVAVLAKVYLFAIIWGILFFFVSLAFWILIALISPYSLRIVVLEKIGVLKSVREGLHFFRAHWKNLVVMYLLLMAIGIGYGIGLILAILIGGGILLAIGYGLYLASTAVAIGYAVLAGLAFFIALIIVSGAYNSFTSTVLTLTYLDLTKK